AAEDHFLSLGHGTDRHLAGRGADPRTAVDQDAVGADDDVARGRAQPEAARAVDGQRAAGAGGDAGIAATAARRGDARAGAGEIEDADVAAGVEHEVAARVEAEIVGQDVGEAVDQYVPA